MKSHLFAAACLLFLSLGCANELFTHSVKSEKNRGTMSVLPIQKGIFLLSFCRIVPVDRVKMFSKVPLKKPTCSILILS